MMEAQNIAATLWPGTATPRSTHKRYTPNKAAFRTQAEKFTSSVPARQNDDVMIDMQKPQFPLCKQTCACTGLVAAYCEVMSMQA